MRDAHSLPRSQVTYRSLFCVRARRAVWLLEERCKRQGGDRKVTDYRCHVCAGRVWKNTRWNCESV